MNTLEYNEGLKLNWYAERGLDPYVPPIENQIATIRYNSSRMLAFPFNASIIRFEDRVLMVYRHRTDGIHSILSIAEFDNSWNITQNKKIDLKEATSQEDAKLFVHNGALWMSWVSAISPNNNPTCVVKFGRLVEGKAWGASQWVVEEIEQPVYGRNDWSAMEKNWVPFSHGGQVHFIYSHGTVIYKRDGKWVYYRDSSLPQWRYGHIKGGTPPVPFQGKWLRFAHSTLDNEPGPWRRRYYMFAIVMEPEPPFSVIKNSIEPIIRGSETCKVRPDQYPQYNYKILFPGGVITHEDGFVVSAGINDAEVILAKVTERDLKL